MNELIITEATRNATWRIILDWVKTQPHDIRVLAMQKYIQEGGPVPNSMGDEARELLKP